MKKKLKKIEEIFFSIHPGDFHLKLPTFEDCRLQMICTNSSSEQVINNFLFSAKICGTIPRSGLTREEGLQLQNTSESHQLSVASFTRHYSEESDSEMDLWVFMSRPVNNAGSSEEKFLRILITPYRKVCDPRDHFYRACHRKNR